MSPCLVIALLDAAEQKDLIVHRETEQQAEEEERHPGLDSGDLSEAEQRGADALLEDQDHEAVGGADRKQVHGDRLRRYDDGAEGDKQEHEAQAEDDRQCDGQPRVEEPEVVHDAGCVARHVDLADVPSTAAGTMSLRRCLTRDCVASPAGSPASVVVTRVRSPVLLAVTCAGAEAPVGLQRRLQPADRLLPRTSGEAAWPSTTIISGLALPSEKSRSRLSHPCLAYSLLGRSAALAVLLPFFMTTTGAATTSSATTATVSQTTGRRMMLWARRPRGRRSRWRA